MGVGGQFSLFFTILCKLDLGCHLSSSVLLYTSFIGLKGKELTSFFVLVPFVCNRLSFFFQRKNWIVWVVKTFLFSLGLDPPFLYLIFFFFMFSLVTL